MIVKGKEMNFTIETPTEVITAPELTAAEKLALSVICALSARHKDYSIDYTNEFFVGINVAKSHRTASRIIKALKDQDWIVIRHRNEGNAKTKVIGLSDKSFKAYETIMNKIREDSYISG